MSDPPPALPPAPPPGGDSPTLVGQRLRRLRAVMGEHDVPALLTADPFSVRYATGTRNMLVHGLTGPDRLALVFVDGPTILWEFAGCDHLWEGYPGIDEIRPAPSLNAKKSLSFGDEAPRFGREVAALVRRHAGAPARVALERLDPPAVDALRCAGVGIGDATRIVQLAMALKQPAEIDAMYDAVRVTEAAARATLEAVVPGRTEQEVWAEFHRALIAAGGELVVTRLLQSGVRTFPYFQEASAHRLADGDLVCLDTDAVATHGYSVDFSRTFLCGEAEPTTRQRELYAIALEQLRHNSANLAPGRSFEAFARRAFEVPARYRDHGYYQLAHGLGLAGGHPNVPRIGDGPYPLDGNIEPDMVLCVESYVGDPETCQGVKLEDQLLVTEHGVETMTTFPLDDRLAG